MIYHSKRFRPATEVCQLNAPVLKFTGRYGAARCVAADSLDIYSEPLPSGRAQGVTAGEGLSLVCKALYLICAGYTSRGHIFGGDEKEKKKEKKRSP